MQGTLKAGEVYHVNFQVYVNAGIAPRLTSGEERLEDILVLDVKGGNKIFVSF